MRIFRGTQHPQLASACALTIGNFDGVHRGHQAMLALLQNEARHRAVPSCVMTFEPHPRDFFARQQHSPAIAPARIATLRDKLLELSACGVDQCLVMPFHQSFASLSPSDFVDQVLVQGLGVKYVLVGDDFRFGAKRTGDYDLLTAAGLQHGFDVARMNSYEISNPQGRPISTLSDAQFFGGLRVSSSAVRDALARGAMQEVAQLLGRPYAISGHVVHGRQLGRALNCRTLNLRFTHWKPAASGIFVVQVHGLLDHALPGVANLGIRPSLDPSDVNGGRVLLETHCLDWPDSLGLDGGYGKLIRVELLHKLHDELKY
ncbi:MAG: bifunctional riboflavin kinase/FAD synthetase, partial [Betaproteobacteria bacterium]|nr:bifunctional riboflavin kinase/FAD synthetase [Betaproteobacteria bacterium]